MIARLRVGLVLLLATAILLVSAGRSRAAGAASPKDAELEARLAIAEVPGVVFRIASGDRAPPAALAPNERLDVNWQSAPEDVSAVRLAPSETEGARVILATTAGDPVLLVRPNEVIVAFDTTGAVRRWPYFNYVLYCAAEQSAGNTPSSFGDWEHAPVPHRGARTAFALVVPILWAALAVAYRAARRRGRATPEAAGRFFAAIEAAASGRRRSAPHAGWNRAGFTRPLAGFLTLLGTMPFMAGAYLTLQWLFSAKIQPFPEADGLWRTTIDTLVVVKLLFECGTNVAAPKYFAQHRVSSAVTALADAQLYVWWQMFHHLAQLTLLGGIGIGVLPYSKYAIYSPFVALFAVKNLPSLYGMGKVLCAGLQRFDFNALLDMAEGRVLVYLLPIPFVLGGRAWGIAHPAYGEVYGAALGMAVGQLAANVIMVALGLWVLRRAGAPLGPLFLAQFDRTTFKRQLWFGAKVAIGTEPIFLIQAVEMIVIVNVLRDFVAWQGVHNLLSGRLQILYGFVGPVLASATAAISEAYSSGKKRLTQYYVARYLQFGVLFGATIFSMMLAIGPAFIAALGPQWSRAAPYLTLAMLVGVLSAPVWLSDSVQQGAGRPGLFVLSLVVEHSSRLLLFLALVPSFQFGGVLAASVGALLVKSVFAWTINHRVLVRFRLFAWPTLGATALAASMNYLLWRLVVFLHPPATTAETLALLCGASALSFFVCFFGYGLAGGFDARLLAALDEAAEMTTVARPMARILARLAALGARLSPIRPAPPALAEDAAREAAELDAASHEARAARSAAA